MDRRLRVRALKTEALAVFDRIIGLDLNHVPLDGSLHKTLCGGEGSVPNPTDRPSMRSPTLACSPISAPLHLDRDYDSGAVRDRLRAAGIDQFEIQLRGTKVPGVKKQPLRLGLRWIVEATNTWWSNYGQPSPQHRPSSPAPPRRALPRHDGPHRRPTHRLARPIEPRVTPRRAGPFKQFGRKAQSCQAGSSVPDRGRPGYADLRYRSAAGVVHIELHRPQALNAWTPAMGRELLDAVGRVSSDDAVRAVLITGAGTAFSAGADVKDARELAADGSPELAGRLREIYNPIVAGIRSAAKPFVAAVQGPCAGLGVSLALACDMVLAAEDAYLLLAFVRLGVLPDGGRRRSWPSEWAWPEQRNCACWASGSSPGGHWIGD